MKQLLSPKEVAKAIGVSESSLKRWVDEGRITASRTAGGHRRIAISEAVRLVRETGLPVQQPEILGLGDIDQEELAGVECDEYGRVLLEALKQGQASIVRGVLLSAYLAGTEIADICDGPVSFAMREIGKLWQESREGIFVEHRATDLCKQGFQALRLVMTEKEPCDCVALGGAPSGDHHILPSLMASVVMASCGYHDMNLGGDTPCDVLADAALRYEASIVWISCTCPRKESEQTECMKAVETLRKRLPADKVSLVVGGAQTPVQVKRGCIEGVQYFQTMSELAAFAKGCLVAKSQ